MLGLKKKAPGEIRWLITFADLITLLFCFFVYLSLFSKPTVSLATRFEITENVIRILDEVMPVNVISAIKALNGQTFQTKESLMDGLSGILGKELESEYKNQIILESVADLEVSEPEAVSMIKVILTDEMEDDLRKVFP